MFHSKTVDAVHNEQVKFMSAVSVVNWYHRPLEALLRRQLTSRQTDLALFLRDELVAW
jgi:hypothetical protein